MAKKEQTRKRIMKVALKLFSKQGYYSTTTKEIARQADINEITLFRHFGTKENLFQETTAHYVKSINIKNEISRLKKQDFEESILEIARDYLDFCYQNEKIYKIQMRLTDDEHDFVKLKLSRAFAHELCDYFTILCEKGDVIGDPEMMAVAFINSILGAFTVYVLTEGTFTDIDLHDLVDEHAKQFAHYYGVPKEEK